jgi:FMS-like tyrosine kinase 1
MGLQTFETGATECINPDLGLDEQAELLPYDKKWEFPRDKLKLGKFISYHKNDASTYMITFMFSCSYSITVFI